MTNTPRLSKSGIEYLDYVWNFYSGCKHKERGICPPVPCWAEQIVRRFKDHYPNGFEPTFYPEAIPSPIYIKENSLAAWNRGGSARIGVCFMGDLFGDWVDINQTIKAKVPTTGFVNHDSLIGWVFNTVALCPHHTFIFLTKNPAGMKAWGKYPGNCEVGFTATTTGEFTERIEQLDRVEARVKWCSLEPLLSWDPDYKTDLWRKLDWVAIGSLTGTKAQMLKLAPQYPKLTPFKSGPFHGKQWGLMPPVEWLKSMVEQLDACGTKVFVKENLYNWLMEIPHNDLYWEDIPNLRQEYGARDTHQTTITSDEMGVTPQRGISSA